MIEELMIEELMIEDGSVIIRALWLKHFGKLPNVNEVRRGLWIWFRGLAN
jgi:hypothetical protein